MKTKFELYTYQISPLTTKQTHIFGKTISKSELLSRKNEIFFTLFDDQLLFRHRRKSLNHKIEYRDKDLILLRIANKRIQRVERGFTFEKQEIEPSCLVAIYNVPDVQLIAIESNKNSFDNSAAVLHILDKTIEKHLSMYQLELNTSPVLVENDLWNFFEKYAGRIQKLRFSFAKPNLARVNKTLSEDLKEAAKNLNSSQTNIEFNSPSDGVLENLTPDNPVLSNMVKAQAEGSGVPKVKIKGIRGWSDAKRTIKSFEIDEIEADADTENIRILADTIKALLDSV